MVARSINRSTVRVVDFIQEGDSYEYNLIIFTHAQVEWRYEL